jgi:uncharacterized protein (DUF58 family)
MRTKSAASVTLPRESRNAVSTNAAGILFGKFSLVVALVLLIWAAWAGLTVIVILLGLGLSAAGLARSWSYYSLKGVSCSRQLVENRAFPDEFLDLELGVANRKLLPLPWLEVRDEVPAGAVDDLSVETASRPGYELINRSTSMLWYSAAKWKYRVHCIKRGYYKLGPLKVSSGDIFGLYPRTAIQPVEDYIIVYPRIYAFNDIVVPSLFPMGGEKSTKPIFEDPTRLAGIRDYRAGDSLRRIHWRASARRQQLEVKVFEPTSTLKVAIFMAMDSFQNNGIWQEEDTELGISTAASLASFLNGKKGQIGLWVNSNLADSGLPARITMGSGTPQLVQVLEGLAKIIPAVSSPFAEFFQNERKELPLGTTLVFILRTVPENFAATLTDLKESGYKVVILQIGIGAGLPIEIAWYSIERAGEIKELIAVS